MAMWLLILLTGSVPASPPAEASATETLAAGAQAQRPQCVDVRGEARYRNYGYDHVAVLRNGCEKPVTCDVSTNVNPEPAHVDVPAGGAAEVLTFRGSPASEFTVRASCRYSS